MEPQGTGSQVFIKSFLFVCFLFGVKFVKNVFLLNSFYVHLSSEESEKQGEREKGHPPVSEPLLQRFFFKLVPLKVALRGFLKKEKKSL